MPVIKVEIDGSWTKAGFNSKYGFVVVLSARTGKVLDAKFKSKLCFKCIKKRKVNNDYECENCNVCI